MEQLAPCVSKFFTKENRQAYVQTDSGGGTLVSVRCKGTKQGQRAREARKLRRGARERKSDHEQQDQTRARNEANRSAALYATALLYRTLGCLPYIYQTLLGWKTYKYYHEANEIPNPCANPTQAKLGLKWATFSPTAFVFSWVGIGFIYFEVGNSLQET